MLSPNSDEHSVVIDAPVWFSPSISVRTGEYMVVDLPEDKKPTAKEETYKQLEQQVNKLVDLCNTLHEKVESMNKLLQDIYFSPPYGPGFQLAQQDFEERSAATLKDRDSLQSTESAHGS